MDRVQVRLRQPLWLVLSLLLLVALFQPAGARACMESWCCWNCHCGGGPVGPHCCDLCEPCANSALFDEDVVYPGRTLISFAGPSRALVLLQGYSTTRLQPLTSCITALSPVSGIKDVGTIVNYNSVTGRPFAEVSFYPSLVPSIEAPNLAAHIGLLPAPDKLWFGFQSKITGTVRDGVPNHFLIEVILEKGVSHEAFVANLKREGIFLTSSSDANGVPSEDHNYFKRISATEVLVVSLPEFQEALREAEGRLSN